MARRSRRAADTQVDVSSADTFDNANPLDGLLDTPPVMPVNPLSRLDEFMDDRLPLDRRQFAFGELEKYTLSVGDRTDGKVKAFSREPIGFGDPSTVAVCVRRKQRREVLHAYRRTRKGSGAGRRRRNEYSNTKC